MIAERLNANQTRTVTGRVRSVLSEARQVRAIVSTENLGRDNCIVESRGVDLVPYRTNPTVLVNHDASRAVARAIWIDRVGSEIHATVQFPPKGVSADSDQTLGLIQAGVLNAASIGFRSLADRPIAGGGYRITRSELYEFSFVAIPAARDALVIERSQPRSHRAAGGDRATPEGRRILAWSRRAALPLVSPSVSAVDVRRRAAAARRRKAAAQRWLAP